MPAVSFLKAAEYQDGHPGYSDPLDEQTFLVNTINQIEQSKYWKSTAIVITYDDSDGWYDHQVMPIVNGSNTAADTAFCSTVPIRLGSYTEPLRLRPAAADAGHLALDPAELRQPQPDQHRLGRPVHRGQLAVRAADRRRLLRRVSGSLYAKGGLLNFRTRPNFRPVILDPTTGEVVQRLARTTRPAAATRTHGRSRCRLAAPRHVPRRDRGRGKAAPPKRPGGE